MRYNKPNSVNGNYPRQNRCRSKAPTRSLNAGSDSDLKLAHGATLFSKVRTRMET